MACQSQRPQRALIPFSLAEQHNMGREHSKSCLRAASTEEERKAKSLAACRLVLAFPFAGFLLPLSASNTEHPNRPLDL